MRATGSDILSLWFADGTDYPGQDDFRTRKKHFEEELQATYAMLPKNARMLVEYKFFEPAFYHTDIADWWHGAGLFAKMRRPRAGSC